MPKQQMPHEQQQKEKIKQEQLAEGMKTRCKICFKETSPVPRCFGHGGGGGGGSGGGDSGERSGKSDDQNPANTSGQIDLGAVVDATTQTIDSDDFSELELNQGMFNPQIISELLSNKLLVIENDRDLGTLTIKLQCDPKLLSEEQRNELKKFVEAILKELDEFTKEKGISTTNCATVEKDNKGNIVFLRIALPTPTIYDAFIQRLANNLLPMQNKEKLVSQEDKKLQTPLATKPTPDKNVKSTDKEKQEMEREDASKKEKYSPMSIPSPSDGLKPKGWKK